MDKKIILKCGIFLLVILSLNMISAAITGSETMTRTASIITVSPGQTFILSYNTVGTSGQWGAIIEDNVSGGCLFPSGKNQYKSVMLSDDGTPKQIQITAPNTTGTCIFTGDYNFGNESIKQFTTETVIIGPNPPTLIINNPSSNITNNKRVQLDIINKELLNKLEYLDNSQSRPRWLTLCNNCYGYNKSKALNEGNHKFVFRGFLSDGTNITNSVDFLIDSKAPKISTTKPSSRKYTNGSEFYIKYTEENCQILKILINGQEILSNQCGSGKNIEKIIPLNISSFNGQEVEYTFTIEDIAGNKKSKTVNNIKVDTTFPVINNPVSFWNDDGKYIYFNLNITEQNLEEATYFYNDSRGKEKSSSICSRLDKGMCNKKVSLKGKTFQKVMVTDKAGNFIERVIL